MQARRVHVLQPAHPGPPITHKFPHQACMHMGFMYCTATCLPVFSLLLPPLQRCHALTVLRLLRLQRAHHVPLLALHIQSAHGWCAGGAGGTNSVPGSGAGGAAGSHPSPQHMCPPVGAHDTAGQHKTPQEKAAQESSCALKSPPHPEPSYLTGSSPCAAWEPTACSCSRYLMASCASPAPLCALRSAVSSVTTTLVTTCAGRGCACVCVCVCAGNRGGAQRLACRSRQPARTVCAV